MIRPEETQQNDMENLGSQGIIYKITVDGNNYESISTEDLKKCERLGSGSQGYIYKIMIDGIYYALKVTKKNPSFSTKEQWDKEIKINRLLSNNANLTNIVRMVNSGEDWMLFELMDHTLSKYIESTRHKMIEYESQLKPIVQQIIKGLELLHSKNIFHGDLKPQNILVKVMDDDSIIIKLADFGCSRITEKRQNETKEKQNTRINLLKADMYSFGIIIHELWFGNKPDNQTVQNTTKSTSPQLIEIINNLITHCVEKRMDIKLLKNDKYWNYHLLQPFPGMKIFKGEFKFDQGIKFLLSLPIQQIILASSQINSNKVKQLQNNPKIIEQIQTNCNDLNKDLKQAQSIEEIMPTVKKIKKQYQSLLEE